MKFGERRARHRRKRDVMVRQVHDRKPSNPSRDRSRMDTPPRVVGTEHEVVDQELRAPSEQVCQRGAAFIGLEPVLLSTRTHGRFCRRRASSSLRRFSSFSASSSSTPRCEPLFSVPVFVSSLSALHDSIRRPGGVVR